MNVPQTESKGVDILKTAGSLNLLRSTKHEHMIQGVRAQDLEGFKELVFQILEQNGAAIILVDDLAEHLDIERMFLEAMLVNKPIAVFCVVNSNVVELGRLANASGIIPIIVEPDELDGFIAISADLGNKAILPLDHDLGALMGDSRDREATGVDIARRIREAGSQNTMFILTSQKGSYCGKNIEDIQANVNAIDPRISIIPKDFGASMGTIAQTAESALVSVPNTEA